MQKGRQHLHGQVWPPCASEFVSDCDGEKAHLTVVHLDHTAKLSGAEISLERLVASRSSTHAHVILGEDGPLRARLQQAGATVEVLPLAQQARDVNRKDVTGLDGAVAVCKTFTYILRLAHRLRRLRPDVVHTNSLKSGYYGALAARIAGVPVVWHVRDRIADDYMPRRTVWLTRFLLARIPDLVVANSQETARTTRVHARVIANSYEPTPGRFVRPTTGETYTVGVVGRISPWKGQDVVLRALVSVPGVNVRFIGAALFGEDRYAHSLRSLAVDLGVADRVTWVGFATDVEAELDLVDVLVHSSKLPEPFGQVVIEGMAAGLPVIATGAGGPAEIVTTGVDGLLTTPGDHEDLALALMRLTDPAERQRLGTAARNRAEDFLPQLIAPQMTAVWREAITLRRDRIAPRPFPALQRIIARLT